MPPPRIRLTVQTPSSSAPSSAPSSPLSPPPSDRPRPTLADIPLPPRRPLRDGSRSLASGSASSRSRSSTSSRGSSSSGGSRRRSVRPTAEEASVADYEQAPYGGYDPPWEADIPHPDYLMEQELQSGTHATRGRRRQPAQTRSMRRGVSSETNPPRPAQVDDLARRLSTGRSRGAPTRSTLLDELDKDDSDDDDEPLPLSASRHRDTHPGSQPFPLHRGDTSSRSSGEDDADQQEEEDDGGRRFTKQEKGKGRAIEPEMIVLEDDSEPDAGDVKVLDGAVVRGLKRRRVDGDKEESSVEVTGTFDADGQDEVEDEGLEEEEGLGSFTCPVCFCQPEKAVITLCGHILCAKCLLDSLTSSIKRNPNPLPGAIRAPNARGAGRGGTANRGRNSRGSHASNAAHILDTLPRQTEWTADDLKAAWKAVHDRKHEERMIRLGVERENWEVMRMAENGGAREEGDVEVKELLKGLWRVGEGNYVVEGECPVCRKWIPGGFEPTFSGIGGVMQWEGRIGGGR